MQGCGSSLPTAHHPDPWRRPPPEWPGQPFPRTLCQVLQTYSLTCRSNNFEGNWITASFGNLTFAKHSSSEVGLHLVWHLCAVMPQLSYAPPPQVSLPLSLSLMKFPTFFCHFNHPHDFQPVLRTVIAHRCVMSAFVAITPRPLIVGGQIFPSFLICQRGREGRGGGTVCARINRKLHSVISQHALFAFTHYLNSHSVTCVYYTLSWQSVKCCYMSSYMWNTTGDIGETHCLKRSMTYGRLKSYGQPGQPVNIWHCWV